MKTIASRADLAINGAPPAFDEPLHVGRPNIGDRDAFLRHVGTILDNQWLTNNGPMVKEFEQRIAARLGVRHCVAMCNGTIALEIAIRALGMSGEVIALFAAAARRSIGPCGVPAATSSAYHVVVA